LTDTTFSVIRYQVARTYGKIESQRFTHQTLAEKEKILEECFNSIELKYLTYCDESDNTLYWLVKNVTRMIVDKSWFMLYLSPTWLQGKASMSRGLQERLFLLAIEIIERTQEMEHDPRAFKWSWLSHNYFQWLPRAFILAELCNRERSDIVDRAWKAINATFETWSQTTANSKNGIMLKRLMAKAKAKREGLSNDHSWEDLVNIDLVPNGELDLQTGLSYVTAPGDASRNAATSSDTMSPLTATLFQWWESPGVVPGMAISNDSIYTGDWNHLATDFGAIIQYDGRPRNMYPVINGGV
jgi:hypothetical protein